jgi:hypothetical protein
MYAEGSPRQYAGATTGDHRFIRVLLEGHAPSCLPFGGRAPSCPVDLEGHAPSCPPSGGRAPSCPVDLEGHAPSCPPFGGRAPSCPVDLEGHAPSCPPSGGRAPSCPVDLEGHAPSCPPFGGRAPGFKGSFCLQVKCPPQRAGTTERAPPVALLRLTKQFNVFLA